ncbi:hypothetical protein HQ865_17390 [Mucilaginibacter mali]|uniref:Capsule assembly protein Wzi n=1 Tax=Mucilaginibacter mali TaxID=2740462 RepID=A0A7D4QB91_9SPHI|nr:capsule assembly Wzi family protein [Mucilaginibacter mali]QKJ31465.1 hypothetical protein HQ865_17390 [Mucilaginibacter mali]
MKVKAQSSLMQFSVESQTILTQPGKLPLWFRANQFGSVPLSGPSTSIIGSAYKIYDETSSSLIDWSAGVQVRGNVGNQAYFTLIEGYVKAKGSIFEVTAGRTKDITGIVDTTLSSGSFSFSGNALGIPKIEIAIPEYYILPIFNRLFSVKGSFSYGFFGNQEIFSPYAYVKNAPQYFQQSQLYFRLGHPDWRLKLFGGINHNVMFGNEKTIFGPGYKLSPFSAAIYAIFGKTYRDYNNNLYDQQFGGKVGNHIGSVDAGATYEFDDVNMLVYHQFIYDIGAIGHLANLADGINGVSFTNKDEGFDHINWHKILIEFISSRNQAGHLGTTAPSGDEDYYNDYEFRNGWSYQGLNMGTPLFNDRKYTRDGLINDPNDHIINNRILGFHGAIQGSVNRVQLTMKLTYTQNFGTYGTAIEGHSVPPKFEPPMYGIFSRVDQFSGYIEAGKDFYNGLSGAVAIGYDKGGIYYNTLGLQLKLKKTF